MGRMNSAEAAEFLGISPRHLRRLVSERRIDFVKIGHLVRFDRADLEAFLANHRVKAIDRR